MSGTAVRAPAGARTPAGSGPGGSRAVLRRSMGPHRARICAAGALFTGHQSGEALVPVLIGVTIDQATAGQDTGRLLLWLVVIAADFAALSLCFRFGLRVALLAGVRADRALRLAVAARVLHSRGMARTDLLPGALLSIATADVRRTTMVNVLLPQGVAAAVGTVVASVALLIVSVPLGLLILLGTPLLLLISRWLSIPLERRAADQQESAAQAAGVAVDLIRGLRVLKGIGAGETGRSRYRSISRQSLTSTLLSIRAEAGQTAAVSAVNGLFLALVALVGGWLAANGHLSVGGLVAAVGLAQFLQGPLGTFGEVTALIAAGRASAARIAGVLDDPLAIPDGHAEPDRTAALRGEIVVSDVAGGGLAGAGFTIAAGEFVGLASTDQAAAATLVRYLGREADPAAGRVLLDGAALTDLAPAALRRVVLVAPHDARLFDGSVQDNIVIPGWENDETGARPGGLTRVVRAAQVDDVAAALPDGLASPVAEGGRALSGGQRQRVALARALSADPPVLVLHDPTTAVDSVTEAQIAAGLRELRAGRTTLVITTSPALLAAADRVLFLDGGTVTATGRHDALAESTPAYRKLVLA